MNSLYINNGFFIAKFPYAKDIVEDIKTIPGRRWHDSVKIWSVPINPSVAQPIVQLCQKHDFVVASDAAAILQDLFTQKADLQELSAKGSETIIEIPDIPKLKRKLFNYQKIGVEFQNKAGRVINADAMGLGKTTQSLASIYQQRAFPCLIVCSRSKKMDWAQEIKDSLPDNIKVCIWNEQPCNVGAHFNIIHYEQLDKFALIISDYRKFSSIILDEFHSCKDSKSLRFRKIASFIYKIPVRIFLSGTPIINGAIDLVAPLTLLGRLDEFGGFWQFVNDFTNVTKNDYGHQFKGSKNEELLNEKLKHFMIRRLKADVLKDLPPKIESIKHVTITNGKEYDALKAETRAKLSDLQDEIEAVGKNGLTYKSKLALALAEINKLRQLTAKGKLPAFREWLIEAMASGEKIVVFAHHIVIQQEIASWFTNNCAVIAGGMSEEEIDRNKRKFQEDKNCKVIIVSLKMGGEGITLTAGSYAAFVELPWTAKDIEQAIDRLHRIGQLNTVNAYYFADMHTIDEWLWQIIVNKRHSSDKIVDGVDIDRVEFLMNKILE